MKRDSLSSVLSSDRYPKSALREETSLNQKKLFMENNRNESGARYQAIVEQIVERWAVGKPKNQSPGSTSNKPSGYYRLTNYLLEYVTLNNTLPTGVHTMPEGRDRFNQVEPSFLVDFDTIGREFTLPD